jgi:hypothetical protein
VSSGEEYIPVNPAKMCRISSDKVFAQSVLSYLKKALAIDEYYKEIFPNGDYSKNEKLKKKIEQLEKRLSREGGPTVYDGEYFKALRKKVDKGKLAPHVFHEPWNQAEVHKMLIGLESIKGAKSAKEYFDEDYEKKFAWTFALVSDLGYLRDENSFLYQIAIRAVIFDKAKKESKGDYKTYGWWFSDDEKTRIEKLSSLLESDDKKYEDEEEEKDGCTPDTMIKVVLFDDIFENLKDDDYKRQVDQARYAFATSRKFNTDLDKLNDIFLHAKPRLKKRIAHRLGKLCCCSSGRSRATAVSSVSEESTGSELKNLTDADEEEDSV